MRIKSKRGFFFSMDALIALMIIVLIIMIVYFPLREQYFVVTVHEDSMTVFSTLKVGEIDNPYVQQLVNDGTITNLNNSILEQIGEFYALGMPEADLLAQEMLNMLNTHENIAIYFNEELLAESSRISFNQAEKTWISRQTISGIQQGESVKGYSARAYLSKNLLKEYSYFGGYDGDGNLSLNIDYDGIIKDAMLEIAINEDFDLYINNNYISSFSAPATPYTSQQYSLTSYVDNFHNGVNNVEIKPTSSATERLLYIAGGYLAIDYEGSGTYGQKTKKYLPGIEGLINLYDSFYIPSTLNSMEIFLHLNTNYDTFMTIGNTTVYNSNTSGVDDSITITNSQLSSLLDYSDMSEKTIPFRLGLENASYIFNISLDVDVFSVTDLSGSMCGTCVGGDFWCCTTRGCDYNEWDCGYCGGICSTDKMNQAKQANKVFLNSVLNISENRAGLVGYRDSVSDGNCHDLSNNNISLTTKINSWYAAGSTCICCGINRAVNDLISDSSPDKFRSIVIMSDGQANVKCSEQGTGSATQDAIQAACDAYENHNIKVYAVGFGEDTDEATLQAIAACGDGSYYYGDIEDLVDIYEQIAEEIKAASYYEQTAEAVGDLFTILYPDSYIEITHGEIVTPYGLIVSAESNEFGSDGIGSFFVPDDADILEANALSYSGSKWTSQISIQNNETPSWQTIFELSDYGNTFLELGDPYVVNIPVNSISKGENNISIKVGLSQGNYTDGSEHNKIIYTLLKQALSYSKICSSSIGCIWNITFEDDTNSLLTFPESYSGTQECYYTPENIQYNENDALSVAVYKLLKQLDFDDNNKVNVKLAEQDLTINSVEVQGIPFSWETEAQIRVWR